MSAVQRAGGVGEFRQQDGGGEFRQDEDEGALLSLLEGSLTKHGRLGSAPAGSFLYWLGLHHTAAAAFTAWPRGEPLLGRLVSNASAAVCIDLCRATRSRLDSLADRGGARRRRRSEIRVYEYHREPCLPQRVRYEYIIYSTQTQTATAQDLSGAARITKHHSPVPSLNSCKVFC